MYYNAQIVQIPAHDKTKDAPSLALVFENVSLDPNLNSSYEIAATLHFDVQEEGLIPQLNKYVDRAQEEGSTPEQGQDILEGYILRPTTVLAVWGALLDQATQLSEKSLQACADSGLKDVRAQCALDALLLSMNMGDELSSGGGRMIIRQLDGEKDFPGRKLNKFLRQTSEKTSADIAVNVSRSYQEFGDDNASSLIQEFFNKGFIDTDARNAALYVIRSEQPAEAAIVANNNAKPESDESPMAQPTELTLVVG